MAKIPPKPNRGPGSVQTRIAGKERESLGGFDRITNDARDTEKGRGAGRRKRSRRRPGQGRNQASILRRWLMLALALAGMAICTMLIWTLLQQGRTARPTDDPGAMAGARPAGPGASESIALVSEMLDASSPADLAPLLRDGGSGVERAWRDLQASKAQLEDAGEPRWLGSFDHVTVPLSFVLIRNPIGDPLVTVLAPNDEGKWRIDAAATFGHCEPPFPEWTGDGVRGGLVRARVKFDNYYNGPFRNDAEWACLRLSNPASDEAVYAYCRRSSKQFDAIETTRRRNERAASTGKQPVAGEPSRNTMRLTLRLQRVEGAYDGQYEITEVVADDWAVGEASLEDLLRLGPEG